MIQVQDPNSYTPHTSGTRRNFTTDFNDLAPSVGGYLGSQKKNARAVRELLMNAGLPADIVNMGTFDEMNLKDAALWVMQNRKETEAYDKNQGDRNTALTMLAREVGDIPADLQSQFLKETGTTNVGSRLDELRRQVMERNALARTGFVAGQSRLAQRNAAQTGQPVTTGDQAALAGRAAVIYGQRLGEDVNALETRQEAFRQQNLGGLTNLLTNYPEEVPAMPQMPATQGITMKIGNMTVPVNIPKSNYGANLVGGNSRGTYGGVNAAGSVRKPQTIGEWLKTQGG